MVYDSILLLYLLFTYLLYWEYSNFLSFSLEYKIGEIALCEVLCYNLDIYTPEPA